MPANKADPVKSADPPGQKNEEKCGLQDLTRRVKGFYSPFLYNALQLYHYYHSFIFLAVDLGKTGKKAVSS